MVFQSLIRRKGAPNVDGDVTCNKASLKLGFWVFLMHVDVELELQIKSEDFQLQYYTVFKNTISSIK